MKPLIHAIISAKKYGGKPEDYQEWHDFFDSSKVCLPDARHRMLLHNSFGIFILERVFGTYIINSDNKKVSVRDIGEEHVIQDLGFIPTVDRCFANMPIEPWMSKAPKKTRKIDWKNID